MKALFRLSYVEPLCGGGGVYLFIFAVILCKSHSFCRENTKLQGVYLCKRARARLLSFLCRIVFFFGFFVLFCLFFLLLYYFVVFCCLFCCLFLLIFFLLLSFVLGIVLYYCFLLVFSFCGCFIISASIMCFDGFFCFEAESLYSSF